MEYIGKHRVNGKEIYKHNRHFPSAIIKPVDQTNIFKQKYLKEYIEMIHDVGIEKKLFTKDFIVFLNEFKKFIKK